MITLFGETETIEDVAKFQLVIFKSSSVIINKQVGNMLLFIQKMGGKKYDRGLETSVSVDESEINRIKTVAVLYNQFKFYTR